MKRKICLGGFHILWQALQNPKAPITMLLSVYQFVICVVAKPFDLHLCLLLALQVGV